MATRPLIALAFLVALSAAAHAGGVPLVDASGANHGTVSLRLSSGLVQMKVKGLAPLLATVTAPSGTFTATVYKAYIFSSADPGIEIFLTDLYPTARLRAARRIALGGDVSHNATPTDSEAFGARGSPRPGGVAARRRHRRRVLRRRRAPGVDDTGSVPADKPSLKCGIKVTRKQHAPRSRRADHNQEVVAVIAGAEPLVPPGVVREDPTPRMESSSSG